MKKSVLLTALSITAVVALVKVILRASKRREESETVRALSDKDYFFQVLLNRLFLDISMNNSLSKVKASREQYDKLNGEPESDSRFNRFIDRMLEAANDYKFNLFYNDEKSAVPTEPINKDDYGEEVFGAGASERQQGVPVIVSQ